ncbi:MAG TPA: anaerobic ribonucleoside-triphosphate reductase activating protein [Candidatus Avalokitesvara rifleensis]|uniref:anaerobic ribonucleoside-triphosphate reductase activating protein n=1 Tax=Candidatus Avalokitesvara rifleensis TaxID=3367620 RepID=UPI002712F1A1|nr:anaerobic ribonucleoside-triphosphate reductase activating protein [Candidatus Brocadiales bacterium]
MAVQIKGFIENSLIEWEGMISSIVFLSGCNFRCSYCHSPHLVNPTEDLETIPMEAVIGYLKKKRGWVDGVVVSGGEPTLHSGLKELLKELKALGLKVKLDTNGTNPALLEELIEDGLLDCVAMDIKAPLEDENYRKVAGTACSVHDLRRSVRVIIESGLEHEFRTTVCPSYLGEKEIEDIARTLRGAKRYVLQSFRPTNCLDPSMLEVTAYPPDKLRHFRKVAGAHVEGCRIRGEMEPAGS